MLRSARPPVYNLRVADYHTYFVGGDVWGWDVWVHNALYARYIRADELGQPIAKNSKFTDDPNLTKFDLAAGGLGSERATDITHVIMVPDPPHTMQKLPFNERLNYAEFENLESIPWGSDIVVQAVRRNADSSLYNRYTGKKLTK